MNHPNQNELFANGENIAYAFLISNGYQVVARNYRCRNGEIDLIATINGILVFIEVKTRSYHSIHSAVANVAYSKQRKITLTAIRYINQFPEYGKFQTRFDVIVVFYNKRDNDYSIKHLTDAFLPVQDVFDEP